MNFSSFILLLCSIHMIVILCKIIQTKHNYSFLHKQYENKNSTSSIMYKNPLIHPTLLDPYNIFHTAFLLM